MSRVLLKPAWVLASEEGDHYEPRLFRLLAAIHAAGKLTDAAEATGMSYRHAWDLLRIWGEQFGSPLVTMARGRGARLTPLGEKLLWAEQRTEASLFPQLENIASELNVEIRKARQPAAPVIRVHASHGYAVEKLPALMREHGNGDVELKYMASSEALASLYRGQCDLASFHVPLGDEGPRMWARYARYLKPRQQRVVRMVLRTQGLMVARGNPRGIRALADLARSDVTFVNRQPESGTRALLDGMLAREHIEPAAIRGYGSAEFTHAAVAAFVASGMADVAIGVEPAARQFKLEFIPLLRERYMLLAQKRTLESPGVAELVGLLRGDAFARMMQRVPGYELDAPGSVVTLESLQQHGT
ncbi:MAG: helix-turn-helix transcriptional regulator [Proteobacteria bacterium]|nr:helix-turn-helix transcriptional regulator [Pseudomonadota bacterium]